MSRPLFLRLCLWTAVAFVLICAWDLLGLDLTLARWSGTATGFPLRDNWLASTVLHSGARRLAWALQFGLVLAIWWPVGALCLLTRRERVHMLAASLFALALVWVLKSWSQTSCPWDLAEFGGAAAYVSHWTWGMADGGEGRCFPAGHASAGFCFLSGYFWLRVKAPRAANAWIAVTLLTGAVIGVAQQVRGAHYISHTLWTAWLCWAAAGLAYCVLEAKAMRSAWRSS